MSETVFGDAPDLTRIIEARDVNGDGSTDVFIGNTFQTPSRFFTGLGEGRFRGRTPVLETGGGGAGGRVTNGRDHNPFGFSIWLAGGGVKGGMTYGSTDDFGFRAVENPVHVHDPHATIVHLMGIGHEKLTYSYSGRDSRLTDVAGNVIHEIIA